MDIPPDQSNDADPFEVEDIFISNRKLRTIYEMEIDLRLPTREKCHLKIEVPTEEKGFFFGYDKSGGFYICRKEGGSEGKPEKIILIEGLKVIPQTGFRVQYKEDKKRYYLLRE